MKLIVAIPFILLSLSTSAQKTVLDKLAGSVPTDTPDKINYPLLKHRTQLVLATLWQLANE